MMGDCQTARPPLAVGSSKVPSVSPPGERLSVKDEAIYRRLFRTALLIRLVEERIIELYPSDKIQEPGPSVDRPGGRGGWASATA